MKKILFGLLFLILACQQKLYIKNTTGHTGIAIYDIEKKTYVYAYQADKLFVPASNIKLFSFYAAIKTFKDSVPCLAYTKSGDTLHFSGMGDPSFLHPDFKNSQPLAFLKNAKALVLHSPKTDLKGLGYGWAWDDYADYYSVERSPLPMYGNIVRASINNNSLSINPPIFKNSFVKVDSTVATGVDRLAEDNVFRYSEKTVLNKEVYDIPFKTSAELSRQLLIDTLKKNIGQSILPLKNPTTVWGSPLDTVLRKMMYESDNFLAEQLLLSAAYTQRGSFSDTTARAYLNTLLADFATKPKIVDGSGLSRYNLASPKMMVQVLNKINQEVSVDSLSHILAVGGKTGNLKRIFTDGDAYIVAKTGSMQGVYCLSGYIKSTNNKWYAFSVMNNNFSESATQMRKNTEAFLNQIRKKL
jgi:serine-type D-Ala-D-Ala carboxypeptidase/endopeptidase (penicillin-binding protein 4)